MAPYLIQVTFSIGTKKCLFIFNDFKMAAENVIQSEFLSFFDCYLFKIGTSAARWYSMAQTGDTAQQTHSELVHRFIPKPYCLMHQMNRCIHCLVYLNAELPFGGRVGLR